MTIRELPLRPIFRRQKKLARGEEIFRISAPCMLEAIKNEGRPGAEP